MENEQKENLLTVPEAAKEAGVSPQAIRNAIYAGTLPAKQMYGRQLISRSDFDAYMETKRRPGRPTKQQDESATRER